VVSRLGGRFGSARAVSIRGGTNQTVASIASRALYLYPIASLSSDYKQEVCSKAKCDAFAMCVAQHVGYRVPVLVSPNTILGQLKYLIHDTPAEHAAMCLTSMGFSVCRTCSRHSPRYWCLSPTLDHPHYPCCKESLSSQRSIIRHVKG